MLGKSSTCSIAFTLAEVLITLGIIGIVAALTLPALITRNQNKALETSLKKNYSALQQALDMYQAHHGERLIPSNIGRFAFKGLIQPYFKVVIDCGNNEKCVQYKGWGNDSNFTGYRTYSKHLLSALRLFDDGQFLLGDGSLIMIENTIDNTQATSGNIFITVDVNGYIKKPNIWGQDLFTFQLDERGKLIPMGDKDSFYNDDAIYCSLNSTNEYNGIACTYKALTDKNYFNNLPR